MISTNIGIWIGSGLTILVWTFLYKETIFYRFAEYTFMGVAIGYFFVRALRNVLDMGVSPLMAGEILMILPIIFGLLLYTNFSKKYRWVSRWPMAVIVGLGTGLAMRGAIKSDFLDQAVGTFLPLISEGGLLTSFNNIVIITCVTSVLIYFIYTFEPKGSSGIVTDRIRKLARILMMVGFGAAYGNVVTYRFTILLGRLQYILYTLLGL